MWGGCKKDLALRKPRPWLRKSSDIRAKPLISLASIQVQYLKAGVCLGLDANETQPLVHASAEANSTLPILKLLSVSLDHVRHIYDRRWLNSLTPLNDQRSTRRTTSIFSSIANTRRCELSDVFVLGIDF